MSKRDDIKIKALDRIARGWNTANIPAKDLIDLICENEYLERRNDEIVSANRAAPELLKALIELEGYVGHLKGGTTESLAMYNRAGKAIAKALA